MGLGVKAEFTLPTIRRRSRPAALRQQIGSRLRFASVDTDVRTIDDRQHWSLHRHLQDSATLRSNASTLWPNAQLPSSRRRNEPYQFAIELARSTFIMASCRVRRSASGIASAWPNARATALRS